MCKLWSKGEKNSILFRDAKRKEVSLTDLTISDLLPRKNLDESSAETNELKDKTILITGAGGSIGSEISRIITQINAKKAILLDISESALFAISQELKEFSSETIIVPVLASVKNKQKLRRYLQSTIQILFIMQQLISMYLFLKMKITTNNQ